MGNMNPLKIATWTVLVVLYVCVHTPPFQYRFHSLSLENVLKIYTGTPRGDTSLVGRLSEEISTSYGYTMVELVAS